MYKKIKYIPFSNFWLKKSYFSFVFDILLFIELLAIGLRSALVGTGASSVPTSKLLIKSFTLFST